MTNLLQMSECRFDKLFSVLAYKRITMKELADAIGVSRATISKLRNDENYVPGFDLIYKASKHLNVPITDLYEPRDQ